MGIRETVLLHLSNIFKSHDGRQRGAARDGEKKINLSSNARATRDANEDEHGRSEDIS